MSLMVIFILNDSTLCSSILDAWEEVGAPGITILESTGLGRVRDLMNDDVPLFPSMRTLFDTRESYHRTLFTVVPDDGMVDLIIKATERVVGSLSLPNTGLLFALPVVRVAGMNKVRPK